MTIDEAIAKYKEIANADANCPAHCNISCDKCVQESKQLAEWLEELKTVENIMLIYNANWYADEDNGVPDSEVLESIWNVIQDNGLDIDIEQDYRKGKVDGYNKAIDDFYNALADDLTWLMGFGEEVYISVGDNVRIRAEQLKEGGENES